MKGPAVQERALNVPNLVTVLRLLLLAPVSWLLLNPPGGVGWAIATVLLLAVWASTDWLDGFLARRLDQVTRVGTALDPIADRLGIAVVVVVLAIRGLLPWWIPVSIVAVDLVMAVLAGPTARRGHLGPSVLGKIRTALLLIGILGLVAAAALVVPARDDQLWIVLCRGVLVIGAALHLIAGLDYLRRVRRVARQSAAEVSPVCDAPPAAALGQHRPPAASRQRP